MKKNSFIIIAAAAALLCACGEQSRSDPPANNVPPVQNEAEVTEVSAAEMSAEAAVSDFIFPSDELLEEAFERSVSGTAVLSMSADGSFKILSGEEYALFNELLNIERLLTGDEYKKNYDRYKGKYSSKNDFINGVKETYADKMEFFDENNKIKADPILCLTLSADGETNKDAFLKAAERFLEKLRDPELYEAAANSLENGDDYLGKCGYSVSDTEIKVNISFGKNGGGAGYSYSEDIYIGEAGEVTVGDRSIPSDTEILCISNGEDYIAQASVTAISEKLGNSLDTYNCKYVKGGGDIVFDMKDIAEKLPCLKALYINSAVCENMDGIEDMTGLETLIYAPNILVKDVSEDAENEKTETLFPFASLPNINTLYISGDFDDFGPLNDLSSVPEIFYIQTTSNSDLESLYACTSLKALELEEAAGRGLNIENISNLKSLKYLKLKAKRAVDLRPLEGLEGLEVCYIKSEGTADNADVLCNLKNLRELTLEKINNNNLRKKLEEALPDCEIKILR